MASSAFSVVQRRLPDGVLEQVRQHVSGAADPVQPRDAATVVLLRDRPGGPGLEVYLLRRVPTMAFAGGMYVFPGGGVDRRDADRAVAWAGPQAADWAAPFGVDVPLARALVCAAVRETFEESGVLLAGADPGGIVDDTRGTGWEADREALIDRSLALAELLDRRGLVLRTDLLRPWAHWITPEFQPRRYDTRFFVAALPEGQHARDVGGEADRAVWMRPSDALAAYHRGEMAMMAPTAATLGELAEFDTVEAVLEQPREPHPWLPKATVSGGSAYLLLPGDPEYGP